VVESFRPGVSDKLGIGYAALRAVNPKIVYCAITGYGQSGPLAMAAGHDLNYIGLAGVLDQIGVDGGQPAIPNLQVGDLLGGAMTAAMGILAALFDAQRSGQGRLVDVAMSEAVLAHNLFPFFALQTAGACRGGGRSAQRRRRGLWRLCDGRRPLHGGRAARKEILGSFLRRARASRLEGAARGARRCRAALRRELEELFASRSQADWRDFFAEHRLLCDAGADGRRGASPSAVRRSRMAVRPTG
jgi:alpha-methylacyl-CoA racemase